MNENSADNTNGGLSKRVVELAFLFKALRIINESINVRELGGKLVEMIPDAFSYPEHVIPYIEMGHETIKGEKYSKDLTGGLHSEIKAPIGTVGRISIFYDKPLDFDLPEEQQMLDILSDCLADWYDGVVASNTIIEYAEKLQNTVEEKSKDLLDAERMAAAGRLAAMVGHDLRSPLQNIRGAVHLIRSRPDSSEEMLKLIEVSVERAVNMLEEFRRRTRKTRLKLVNVQLLDLMSDILAETVIPDNIELHKEQENIPTLRLDPLQIHRVFENLFNNAFEAMPDCGKLSLKIANCDDGVLIEVSDTGGGIPESQRDKIFKPFYTTKDSGLGLGLSYCMRTVKAHGGEISYESNNSGTTFKIFLPLHYPAEIINPQVDIEPIQVA